MDFPEIACFESNKDAKRISVQLWTDRLVHAIYCRLEDCQAPSCKQMKCLIQHTRICRLKTFGACQICKQLVSLCCYHTKDCLKESKCSVPFCSSIKQKMYQKQQQALLMQTLITPTHRGHVKDLLLETISPYSDSVMKLSGLVEDKLTYATTLERQMYDSAVSASDYYRLLAARKWEIQMDLEEARMEDLAEALGLL